MKTYFIIKEGKLKNVYIFSVCLQKHKHSDHFIQIFYIYFKQFQQPPPTTQIVIL